MGKLAQNRAQSGKFPLTTLVGIMNIMRTIGKLILVGFFVTMFGCGKNDGRFVTENKFKKNIEKQVAMSPQTLKQLRQYNVTARSELKLEYFFYTDTAEKSAALAGVLSEKGYTAEHGLSAREDKTYLVTGWTTPIIMDETSLVEWTRQMCVIGFEYDSNFDGWGTNPNQN
jgi:hypothetical protein